MRDHDHKIPCKPNIAVLFLTCGVLFTLGCNLFSAEYWIHRLNDKEADQTPESLPNPDFVSAGPENDSNFGSKCIESPGILPCPIDACVAYKGEFTAKYVVTSELFGKANPSDYQCSAEFRFTNRSGVDLMGFEHRVTEFDDNWYFQLYPAVSQEQTGNGGNYFTRKDGQETLSKGVTEIVVLYDNSHCEWIQWNEPGLTMYRVPVETGCYSNP